MPKPRNTIPSVRLKISIPETEKAKLDLLLFVEGENRVPQGAYAEFLMRAIREAWELKALDLAPYIGSPPGVFVLHGSEETLNQLKKKLQSCIY